MSENVVALVVASVVLVTQERGHVVSEELTDLLVGGYGDLASARRDFDAVVDLVKAKQVKVQGVILVAHDQDGDVTVVSTGDHLGRKGLGWGAGVGVVVGPVRAGAVGLGGGGRGGRGHRGEVRRAQDQDGIAGQAGPGSAGRIGGDHCHLR